MVNWLLETGLFLLGVALIPAVGLLLICFGLWGDRSRGRRRCPECWYDMCGTVPKLVCPECGHNAGTARRLYHNRRRWRPVVFGVASLVLSVAVAACALPRCYQDRSNCKCASCQSRLTIEQWRLGRWGRWSVALTPVRERIRETQLRRDFFAPSHQHDWELITRNPHYLFSTGFRGCAVGSARSMNNFTVYYELDANLRRVTQAAIDSGRASEQTIRQIVALPAFYELEPSAAAKVSASIDLAQELLTEAGLGWLNQ